MALTPPQTQSLHKAIEQRRAMLMDELREDVERVRRDRHEDLAGASPDAGDASVATLIADSEQADLGRDLTELRALELARARLSDGSYGICVDCGRDIGFERLKANPSAIRCIEDQTRYEKTFGSGATPSL
jgi:RNA polymerase-binding transcription factor DksA